MAVVPGSLIGALPPAIGWTAAGGLLSAPAILSLGFVLFLWQVPHFWLLALMHRAGYERAGFPTLSTRFQEPQILRLVFTWTCAAVAACAMLPAFGALRGLPALVLLGVASLWLLVRATRLFQPLPDLRRAFMDINVFALAVMVSVILGSVWP
jgi:protoheme IX farnesyltransferase